MDKLKKYIAGGMNEKELEGFSEELISAKLDQDKKKAWQKKLAEQHDVHRSSPQKPTHDSMKWLWIGIAVLFLSVLLFYVLQSKSTPTLEKETIQYIAQLDIMSDQSSLLRGKEGELQERILANEAYAKKDYKGALSHWKIVEENKQLNKMDAFYMGLCQLQQTQSNPGLAIQYLEQSKSKGGPIEEINWALSLAYLQANKNQNAKALLTEIQNTQSYNHQKAMQLLELMK